jgi:hypothetical protein
LVFSLVTLCGLVGKYQLFKGTYCKSTWRYYLEGPKKTKTNKQTNKQIKENKRKEKKLGAS